MRGLALDLSTCLPPIELPPELVTTRLLSWRGPVLVGLLTLGVALAGGLVSIELRQRGASESAWHALQVRAHDLTIATPEKSADIDMAAVALRPTIAPIAADATLRPSLPAAPQRVEVATLPGSHRQILDSANGRSDDRPRALCQGLSQAGLDSSPWRLDPLSGRWSCASDVVRFGETDASLYVAITGGDADTLSLVRLKLNLLAPSANDAVKRRAAAVIERLAGQIGLELPPEARASILSGSPYQLADGAWRFSVRPQENDPARINIFLRNVSAAFGAAGETG